jgi:LuxR family maltose regulon positive regulatory protein
MRRSTQLVWTHLARYLAAGRCPDVERWLQGFTDAQLHRDASLSLAAAGCALMAGRNAEHWLRAAEECQRSAEPEWPDDLPSVPVAIGLLHGVLAKAGPVAMGADAERIYDIATTDDPSRALAAFLAGVSYSFTGDSATALKWLEEGEQLAALLGLPATRAACLGQRAILAFHSDDWARADALATRAVAIATQFGLENVKTMAPVYAASALSLAHRHRVDEAQRAARRARRMTAGIARGVDWQAHQCRILLARTYLLLEDAGNARLLVDEARKASGPGASDLRNDLDDVQRLTDAMPVAGQSGGAAITAAERRVLQLLRTHLSFSEIGDVLLRSRNTVKTQAISIYRKLDVGSRGEAVEQATKLGLN